MQKLFIISLGLSVLLAKIGSITPAYIAKQVSHNAGRGTGEIGSVAETVGNIWETLGLYNLRAFNILDLGHGFETTSLLINYILTYTPIIFGLLLAATTLKIGLGFLFGKRSKKVKAVSKITKKKAAVKPVKPVKKAVTLDTVNKPKMKVSMPKINVSLKMPKFKKKTYEKHWIGRYWLLRLVLGKDLYRQIPFN